MKKLIKGIVEFRKKVRPEYRELFSRLALGQSPDSLFIACSDSRVVPNLFASTDPGDLFVIRNVGNLVPPDSPDKSVNAEAAALEFAILNLKIRDIIVCGHSNCGAMQAIHDGIQNVQSPSLKNWLVHGAEAKGRMGSGDQIQAKLEPVSELSQLNVLLQLEHLRSYEVVQKREVRGELRLHGWWFDIGNAEVHAYEQELKRFVPIDEDEANKILSLIN